MTLKDLFEDVAAGSTGSADSAAFAGRMFAGSRPIKRVIAKPSDKVPIIQYSSKQPKVEKV